jgi:hypothetical protein
MVSKQAPWSENSLPDQAGIAPTSEGESAQKRADRSAVTNGTRLLPGVDGRNAWARRCRDIIREHLADLGGPANTTAAERSLVRRAATLTIALEQLEAKFAAAEGVVSHTDLDLYSRGTGHLRRVLESLGLQRRAKDITPGSNALIELLTLEGKIGGNDDHE